MEKLISLFKLFEITRNHPQYGYSLAGISKSEMSDLAQHQYLVALIGLQLGYYLNEKGAGLDIQKVLEICLLHDLGELFGGDINFFYGRANPAAREKAKAFEAENVKYISSLMGGYGANFEANNAHFENKDIDEAIVSQCADKIECIHYKAQIGRLSDGDVPATRETLLHYAKKASGEIVRRELPGFIEAWSKQVPGKSLLEDIASEIKEYT